MTYLYYKTTTWTNSPKINEETVKQWAHLADKKNIVIVAGTTAAGTFNNSGYVVEAEVGTDSDGTFFRKVLARKFHLDKNRIILGSGSDQIFELVCKLFLNKGDEVVVSEHSFIIYRIYSR